jgi:hypothetical protein
MLADRPQISIANSETGQFHTSTDSGGHKGAKLVEKLEYRNGSRSASDLSAIVAELLDELREDEELQQEVRRHNVDPTQLSQESIQIEQGAAGIDPATVTLIVTFAGPPALDIWKHVLLPRIRRRWGADVVGTEGDQQRGR